MALNLKPKSQAAATPQADPLQDIPLEDPNFDPKTNPVVAKVLNAEVAGVTVPQEDFEDPLIAPLNANGRALVQAGLGVVPTKSGVAIYNPAVVKPEEAAQYANDAKVDQLFPNWRSVIQGAVGAMEPPAGGKIPSMGTSTPPQAPQAQRVTATARNKAATANALPNTKKAVPAGGSLINSLIRGVV